MARSSAWRITGRTSRNNPTSLRWQHLKVVTQKAKAATTVFWTKREAEAVNRLYHPIWSTGKSLKWYIYHNRNLPRGSLGSSDTVRRI
jgi:hypothetical protein